MIRVRKPFSLKPFAGSVPQKDRKGRRMSRSLRLKKSHWLREGSDVTEVSRQQLGAILCYTSRL